MFLRRLIPLAANQIKQVVTNPIISSPITSSPLNCIQTLKPLPIWGPLLTVREFHAKGSKVKYLDFRYRFPSQHLRLHLLIIRRQKMKKHQRRKFRRKYKCLLAKKRLKREIAKEKSFRVELLSMIRTAESFDPREYAQSKIFEINNQSKEISKEEKFEHLKELIRKHRHQVTYVKPNHPYPRQ